MNIYMTGGRGMIGRKLAEYGVQSLDCDITLPHQIDDTVSQSKPEFIIHLAAISNVDYCEQIENEKAVIGTNLRGTYNLLTVAEKYEIPVVMISSDAVFSGKKWFGEYKETSTPHPVNFYGKTKLAAEGLTEAFSNFKIIRSSYLFNAERLKPKKQESQPTFIRRSFMYLPHFVARLMMYVYNYEKMPTVLHIAGSKCVSWYDLMSEFCKVEPRKTNIESYAPRPHRVSLGTQYKFFMPVSYKDGIDAMLHDS